MKELGFDGLRRGQTCSELMGEPHHQTAVDGGPHLPAVGRQQLTHIGKGNVVHSSQTHRRCLVVGHQVVQLMLQFYQLKSSQHISLTDHHLFQDFEEQEGALSDPNEPLLKVESCPGHDHFPHGLTREAREVHALDVQFFIEESRVASLRVGQVEIEPPGQQAVALTDAHVAIPVVEADNQFEVVRGVVGLVLLWYRVTNQVYCELVVTAAGEGEQVVEWTAQVSQLLRLLMVNEE